ncbi:heavy-metal-associated domain-containing protein [Micrococcales bacterium 31B]|nr:heavy-metal-associated domain-containing protein [Micrococcales bacterium 31B]
MSTLTFTVTGMTCEHCERSVREEVGDLAGVESIEVSAANGTLSVTGDVTLTADAVIAAVNEAGYTATPSEA